MLFQRILDEVVKLKAGGVLQIVMVDQLPVSGSNGPYPVGDIFRIFLLITGPRALDEGDAVPGFLSVDDRNEGSAFQIIDWRDFQQFQNGRHHVDTANLSRDPFS